MERSVISWDCYKAMVTVQDAIDAGFCLEGLQDWILGNGMIIAVETESFLHVPEVPWIANGAGAVYGLKYTERNGSGVGERRGYGYGYGYGDGCRSGDGYGYGSGNGYGCGCGNGNGNGYGNGYGDDDGDDG